MPQAPAFVAHLDLYQVGGEARRLDGAGCRRSQGNTVNHIHQVVQGLVAVVAAPGSKTFINRADQLSGGDDQEHLADNRNERRGKEQQGFTQVDVALEALLPAQ